MTGMSGRASELATFDPEGFRPNVLFGSGSMNVVLVALEEGQRIDLHDPPVDLAVAVLQGVGEVWIDDRPRTVQAGDVAVVPAGVIRGVRATAGRLIALHVVSPPPDDRVHEAEQRPWPQPEKVDDPAAPIRAEHRSLLPHLEHLAALADEALTLEPEELRRRLGAVLEFLREVLLPHAGAEETALYPVVDDLLRATGEGSRTMSLDHRAIGRAIDQLSEVADGDPALERRSVQRTLDGLTALVRVHFEKEEEAYLPLLRLLSTEQARSLGAALAHVPGHEHAQ